MIVVGETGVGKTCLLKKYIGQRPPEIHNPTIGVEFCMKQEIMDNEEVVKA